MFRRRDEGVGGGTVPGRSAVGGQSCTEESVVEVESYIAFMVEQRAATASEVVLLHYRHLEASFCEASRCRDTTHSSTWSSRVSVESVMKERVFYQLQWLSSGSSFLS